MNWNVITLPEAREDYDDILTRLSRFYPSTPGKFYAQYIKAFQRLKEDPHGPSVFYDNPKFKRMIVDKRYILLYTVSEERHMVFIHRVLPGWRDIPRVLQGEEPEAPDNESTELKE